MGSELVIFCLAGGVVYADTHAVGQVGISLPMMAAAFAGAILGNVTLGLTIGILMQLPYLLDVPVGGAKISISGVGAFVAAGLAVVLEHSFPARPNSVLLAAILSGIAVGWATLPLQDGLWRWNLRLVRKADFAAERGKLTSIDTLNYVAAGGAFLFGAVVSCGWLLLGLMIWTRFLAWMPQSFDSKLQLLAPVLLGAGLASFIWRLIRARQVLLYPLMGVALGSLFFLVRSVG
ncbi:PTS sugar transporter subunit IIC [bacterium]|nr:PTS sugar transporter subunit IIC [bacterium]